MLVGRNTEKAGPASIKSKGEKRKFAEEVKVSCRTPTLQRVEKNA